MLINASAQDEANICMGLLEAMRSSFRADKSLWTVEEYRDTIKTGRMIGLKGDALERFWRILGEHQQELARLMK